jgi:hypothetical protein
MERQLPETDHDVVMAIWHGFYDPVTGVLDLLLEHSEQIKAIEQKLPELWTRAQHEDMHERYVNGRKEEGERRKLGKRDWIMIMITFVMAVGTVLTVIIK